MAILNALPSIFEAPKDNLLYVGKYDPLLVTLSIAIAILASYAALLVSRQVGQSNTKTTGYIWMLIGGLCLGLGIWSMHFVGMLAFSLPCSTSYDPFITGLSTIPGILASVLAIRLISRTDRPSLSRLLVGGVLIGSGIGTMHYTGMAALRLNGLIRYDITLFLLSIFVAVLLAMLALWLQFGNRRYGTGRCSWLSALVLGLAVSGMHYTAMTAAYFVRGDEAVASAQGMSSTFLAAIVLSITSLIVVATIASTLISKLKLKAHGRFYRRVGLLIAGWIAISWFGASYYYEAISAKFYQREAALASQQAEIIASSIDENLAALKSVPRILAREQEVHQAMLSPGTLSPGRTATIAAKKRAWSSNRILRQLDDVLATTASGFDADVVWVMNASGDCIASSNHDQPESFVGTNYADRQYFKQAAAGKAGSQYAVGRTSNIPGLYFSFPVLERGRVLGVVAVKRNITRLSPWMRKIDAFLVDADGVVVLSSNRWIEFHALPGAPALRLSQEQIRRQYKLDIIPTIDMSPWKQAQYLDAWLIHGNAHPATLNSAAISENVLKLYVSRPLDELERYAAERYWLFLLIFAAGSMLIVAASAVALYLRESQKAEANLRIAATAFDSQEGMMITDGNTVILKVNKAFTEITGYTTEDVIGRTPRLLRSGLHDPDFYAAMWASIHSSGYWKGEIWNRRKNGEIYPELLTITAVKTPEGEIANYVGTLIDITKSKRAEEEIRKLAFYDPLTDLPNRRLLIDRLQQSQIASARSHRHGALLFIDLDNFKTLNDTMGHDVGDLLLKQVAERLKSSVRDGDTVARLGGDEFVVLLEDLSENLPDAAAQAEAVGEKIMAILNNSYRLEAHEFRSTPSIGVTLFAGRDSDIEELMKQADIAMYQSKKAGRNTLRFFDPAMQSLVSAHVELEAALLKAVSVPGQLVLYYQPQVAVSGKVIGAEALVRWNHPERGWISPGEFIPIAEESGLILPLGHWVLAAACQQLAKWANTPETSALTLAVNISAKQFSLPTFPEEVLALVKHAGIDPSRLKLEITEGMLLSNIEDIITKMRRLKDKGISFAMDDFGTGYSSLRYLKHLPLDQLKIDQSFVRDLVEDSNDRAIVNTVIVMAYSLGMDVIAEGVETEAQREILMKNGCSRFQGYLFGKPVPVESFNHALPH